MYGGGVSRGSDDEGGAGVEDSSAAFEARVLAINGDGSQVTFPESLRVDVVEGNESLSVELGRVKTTEGDLTVVLLVLETRDLVGLRDEVL